MKKAPLTFMLNDFSLGIDWSSPSVALDKRALSECINFNITKSKGLQKRSGITKLYPTYSVRSPILALFEYSTMDYGRYLLVAVDTFIKYYHSSNGWTNIVTGLTTDERYNFVTHQGICYVTNGINANFKIYCSATNTFTTSALGITAPAAAPTAAGNGTGAFVGKWRYSYAYKRSAGTYGPLCISNCSDACAQVDASAGVTDIQVDYIESSDPQVDKIVICFLHGN
jgi:hypothetical protein